MLGEETMASLVQLDRLFTQHNSQQLAHFININFCVNDYDMPWEHLVNMVETSWEWNWNLKIGTWDPLSEYTISHPEQ